MICRWLNPCCCSCGWRLLPTVPHYRVRVFLRRRMIDGERRGISSYCYLLIDCCTIPTILLYPSPRLLDTVGACCWQPLLLIITALSGSSLRGPPPPCHDQNGCAMNRRLSYTIALAVSAVHNSSQRKQELAHSSGVNETD